MNQVAISNQDGFLELYIDPNHSGDNRPIFTDGRYSIKVPSVTLDTYFLKAKLDRVDFLKIDIQGGEIQALEGTVNLIKMFRPLLLVEVANELDTGRESINLYIVKFAETFGYHVYKIENGQQIKMTENDIYKFRGNLFLKAI